MKGIASQMIKTIKKYVAILAAGIVLSVPVMAPAMVGAAENNISNGLKCGVNLDATSIDGSTSSTCDIDQEGTSDKVNEVIRLSMNVFSLIVGIVAVFMIIIGGLKYITSGGDASNVTGAKNTIMFAIIGLIVVALAQFIVRFVLSKLPAQ